ncbi:MAG: glycosyltransferase family 39 protein [Sphingomonas sp.]
MTAPSRREALALAAILLAAAAIRVALAGFPLWFDELASLFFAHQPLGHLWSGWMTRETNPPLYYTLLRGWIALVGDGDRALRLLSILIGLTGIAAAWALARRLGGVFAGLAAAAMMTLSAAHVATSIEVRGYMLADAAALIGLVGVIDYLGKRRAAALLLYALSAVIALYSHTTMIVFVALVGGATSWLLRRDARALAGWIIANAAVALSWSWWAWISLGQVRSASGVNWIAPVTPGSAVRITEVAYLPPYLAARGGATALLLVALAVGIVLLAWRDRRPPVILLAVLALAAPATLYVLSLIKPILLPRTLYWAAGPVVVLVALALARLASRRVAVAALGVLLVIEAAFVIHWMPVRQDEDWPGALRAVAARDPHAVLLVEGDAMAVAAAHYQALAPGVRLVMLRQPTGGDRWAVDGFSGRSLDAAEARMLLRREHRLFALVRADHDPGPALAGAGQGRLIRSATRNRQPWLWEWQASSPAAPHAALSMPSSPSLR